MQIRWIYTQVTHSIKKSQKQTHSYYRSWSQGKCLINICCISMQLFGSPKKWDLPWDSQISGLIGFFMYLFVPPPNPEVAPTTWVDCSSGSTRYLESSGSTVQPHHMDMTDMIVGTHAWREDFFGPWKKKYIYMLRKYTGECKITFILCILLFQ